MTQTFELINGIKIPKICFGTNSTFPVVFGAASAKECIEALYRYSMAFVRPAKSSNGRWNQPASLKLKTTRTLKTIVNEAQKYGVFAFDTARLYGGSERRLARGLRGERNNSFIITKIAERSQFLGAVEQCFQTSLNQLKTDYVDLLLLHWPVDYPAFPDERFTDNGIPIYARSWKTLENIYRSGKAKAIGVSNFSVRQLEVLKKYADIMPMANQFECHPLCIREELNQYCADNDIHVLAYAALCGMDNRLLAGRLPELAKAHDKSIAQIILRWHIQSGRTPIFGTRKKHRLKSYAEIFDFALSKEELDIIDNCNINYRAYPDSEKCDFTKGIFLGWENYKDYCP